jgi:hypothetical protein
MVASKTGNFSLKVWRHSGQRRYGEEGKGSGKFYMFMSYNM